METDFWGTGTVELGLPRVVGRAGGLGLVVTSHQVKWKKSV